MKNEIKTKLWEVEDYPNIDKIDVSFQNDTLKQKHNLCASKKLREIDNVIIGGDYKKISWLIETDPILLWSHIHTIGNKTSLVRTAYAKLKTAVSKINPILIEENIKKRSQHIASKKLNREANNGILGTPLSNFQKKK